MTQLTLALLLAALVAAAAAVWFHQALILPPEQAKVRRPIIFGFLPDYRFEAADSAFMASHVTHLCLFGSEADLQTGEPILRLPASNKLAEMAPFHPKVFIGFGGAGRSQFFREICSSWAKTQTFLSGLDKVKAMDGIELNWQYPQTRAEFQCLKRMVEHMRQKLDLQVSISLPPNLEYARMLAAQEIPFTHVHVMLYQAAIGKETMRIEYRNLVLAIARLFPRANCTLALPFFSRAGKSYEEAQEQGEGCESAQLLRDKLAWTVATPELAGVAIWELGQDCRPQWIAPNHVQTCARGAQDSLLYQLTLGI